MIYLILGSIVISLVYGLLPLFIYLHLRKQTQYLKEIVKNVKEINTTK